MNDRGTFLCRIHDRPDDDGARLVYADWLDEQGDDQDRLRAELIRLQVAIARDRREDVPCTCPRAVGRGGRVKAVQTQRKHSPGCPWKERYAQVIRCNKILDTCCVPNVPNKVLWFTALFDDHAEFRPGYCRGFVGEILWRVSLASPVASIDKILERVPTVGLIHVEEQPELRTRIVRPDFILPSGFFQVADNSLSDSNRGAWVNASESPFWRANLWRVLEGTWPGRRFNFLWGA